METKMKRQKIKPSQAVEVRVGSIRDMRADVNALLSDPAKAHSQPAKVVYLSPEDVPRFLSGERIRLIHKMRDGEYTIGELAAALKRKRENVSRDLRMLSRLGLIEVKRTGRQIRPIAKQITVAI
jgi:predicted transcriptional regulator